MLLCSGAIGSPQILQRSGVGPGALLRELGIPIVHDLPGVGANLQDHLEMYLQYTCKQPVSLYPALQMHNQPLIGAEWLFLGKGIGASNQLEAGGFIRSRAKLEWPNIQYHFLPVAINYNGTRRYRAAPRPTTSPQTPRRATCRRHSQLARKWRLDDAFFIHLCHRSVDRWIGEA